MRQSVAKIRSITRKSDGFKVRVIEPMPYVKMRENNKLIQDAHALSVQSDGEPIHGYAIVTWTKDGYRENAYAWKDGSVISPEVLPDIVRDSLKNSLVANGYIGSR